MLPVFDLTLANDARWPAVLRWGLLVNFSVIDKAKYAGEVESTASAPDVVGDNNDAGGGKASGERHRRV
jgi:hypothetical protein